ncbi:LacI family DNA-binding transcriptional regulator [Tessaracoccus sp. MC1865]|uniref:LacI family DNA-binding transcriptional regulator n=1 Tax=unclassified Tessaracoccus TaxID=2635419 RepID=UPI001FD7EE54|nr:LacI family DNA-binding transcriptional regulator [Tessaracoccus sp. MC1865]
MIPQGAKLADLARAAGVSTATVSRVLNGKPGVAETTRRTVLSSIEALGYFVDDQRAGADDGFIAVMVPELGNPGFAAFAAELSLQLSAAGRHMILCTAGPGATTEVAYLDALLGVEISGIISVSGTLADKLVGHDHYQRLISAGVPAVFINAHDPNIDGSFFSTSDAEAVAMSLAHLRQFGHEKIGLAVGQQRYLPAQRKIDAFLAHGLSRGSIVSTIFSVEGGQSAAARLLEAGHTAIICGSDLMALGAIREAHARGLDVPGHVSVVGYDDSPVMAFTSPGLTTVRQPVAALCQAAVGALMSAIRGLPTDSTEMFFHPDLIIRQSTGPHHGN